jgi:hypothetical protein
VVHSVESLSVSFRPFERSAVNTLRDAGDINQLHSLRPLEAMNAFARGSDGLQGNMMTTSAFTRDAGRDFSIQTEARDPLHIGPSMADQVSFLSGINDAGNVVAQSFWTWRGNNPATYSSNSDASKWGADHATDGEVVTVNYFFQSNWNATEKGVWESCLSLWSAVTNIEFNEVGNKNQADLLLRRGNDGSAYQFDQVDGGNDAGEIGGSELWVKEKAVISIDTSVPGFGPMNGDFSAFGGYVWGTVVHELGHSLGLGHAGPYNGSVAPKFQQFSAFDTLLYSVMSYIGPEETAKYDDDYPVQADWAGNTATTWMALDILAVQQLYGTPLSTPLSGGQTFGFNCDVGGDLQRFFDFTVNEDPVITLWSAGANNTLDLSGFNTGSDVDLNPGGFTSCAGMVANIVIAFDTVFETAVGGKAADTFTANALGNTLIGNRGSDTFHAGAGHDFMNGGKGGDTFVYDGATNSTSTLFDTVQGFDFNAVDRFDLSVAVSGVDATVNAGSLSDASFDVDLTAAVTVVQLAAGHAVLFNPNAGDHAGDTFLVVDVNGVGGYQASADLVVQLTGARNVGFVDGADFI